MHTEFLHKRWLQYKCAFKCKIIKYELFLKCDFFIGLIINELYTRQTRWLAASQTDPWTNFPSFALSNYYTQNSGIT